MKPKQSQYVKTALRLPPELHRAVHEAAQQQDRTFNGQLIALLRGALPAPRPCGLDAGAKQ